MVPVTATVATTTTAAVTVLHLQVPLPCLRRNSAARALTGPLRRSSESHQRLGLVVKPPLINGLWRCLEVKVCARRLRSLEWAGEFCRVLPSWM